uniref:Putative secreted protein n=1 Tax=Anopheles darlingi TaxID=43151 RepID=A0A2M4CJR9_ANODA
MAMLIACTLIELALVASSASTRISPYRERDPHPPPRGLVASHTSRHVRWGYRCRKGIASLLRHAPNVRACVSS